ncbi:MAG TPA: hypothetical protein VGM32_15455, partial [Rhodopila sp.]
MAILKKPFNRGLLGWKLKSQDAKTEPNVMKTEDPSNRQFDRNRPADASGATASSPFAKDAPNKT